MMGHPRDARTLLLGAAACGLLALLVWPLDRALVLAVNGDWGPWATMVLLWLHHPGTAVLSTAVLCAAGWCLLVQRRPGRARMVALGALLVLLQSFLVDGVKQLELRARPSADSTLAKELHLPLGLADRRSLPSGHCATTAAIAGFFWLLAGQRRGRSVWWAVAALMAVDRVALGVHYPSDTLAGTALGLGAMGLVALVVGRRKHAEDSQEGDRILDRGAVRVAVGLLLLLALFGVWHAPMVAWDPVTGQQRHSFHSEPHLLTVCFEPVFGVALFLAGEPARTAVMLVTLVGLGIVGVGLWWWKGLGALLRTLILAGLWAGAVLGVYRGGWAPPDRYGSRQPGVFIDWHLHGGDPVDGRASAEVVLHRQAQRGVAWPLLSWHSQPGPGQERSFGVVASEWSGPDFPATATVHLLIVGSLHAVERANQTADPLEAIRRARAEGALVILNHGPRTMQKNLTMPAWEDLLAAGLSGFEVANRRREVGPAARAWYEEVDRFCRQEGLLRVSFSDDHGTPAGSPCVTFLRGVDEKDLRAGRGPDLVARLADPTRRDPEQVQPLLWNRPWLGEGRVGTLVRPVVYLRSRTMGQLLSWFVWLVPLVLWVLRGGCGRRSEASRMS